MAERKLIYDDEVPVGTTGPGGPPGPERKLIYDDTQQGSYITDVPGRIPAELRKPAVSDVEKRLTEQQLKNLFSFYGDKGSYNERLSSGVSFGLRNPMAGVGSVISGELSERFGKGEPATVGERWRAGVNSQKQFDEQNREKTSGPLGWATDAAAIVGSGGRAALPSFGANVATKIPVTSQIRQTLPQAIGTGAVTGGVSGAAENAQDAESALKSGAVGSLLGGGTAGVLHGLLSRFSKVKEAAATERQAQRGPTADQFRDKSKALFKQLDDAGIEFDAGQAKTLAQSLPGVLKKADYDAALNKDLAEIVKDLGAGRQGLTFADLAALQGRISAAGRSANANDRRVASHLSGMLEDFLENTVPATNRTGVDVAKIYPEARKHWRTFKLDDAVNAAEEVAERTAASKPGSTLSAQDRERASVTNKLNRITQGKEYNPFTPAQKAAAEQVSGGTGTQSLLEGANKYGATWPVAGSVGTLLANQFGLTSGNPQVGLSAGVLGGLGTMGAGKIAKAVADSIGRDNMDAFVRSIVTGSPDKLKNWNMARDQLAALLGQRGATIVSAPAVVRGVINKEPDK